MFSCYNPCVTKHTPKLNIISKKIQIMVVGDKNVGKSMLIDSYLKQQFSDHHEDVRIKTTSLSWMCKDKNTRCNVGIRIVDIKNNNDTSSVENRKMFYDVSNIIFVVYNSENEKSIDRIKSFWEAEINEAFEAYTRGRKKLVDSKLVILGVNPDEKSVEQSNITHSLKGADKLKSMK